MTARAVWRYAVATARAQRDITGDLKGALTPHKKRHFAAITDPAQLGTLIRVNKIDVADLLALHPRTLQRHLAAENTTFEALREEARREAALHYLRETRIPLGQLADVLGFSEQSAMTRSCRRWFGMPPTEIRRAAHCLGLVFLPDPQRPRQPYATAFDLVGKRQAGIAKGVDHRHHVVTKTELQSA